MDIDFPLILVILVFGSGLIWALDALFLAPGRRRAVAELQSILQLEHREDGTYPAVLKTEAATGQNVAEVHHAITEFVATGQRRGHRLRERADVRLRYALTERFLERLTANDTAQHAFQTAVGRIAAGEVDPYSAAEQVMAQIETTGRMEHDR